MSFMRFTAGAEVSIDGRPLRLVELIRRDGESDVWYLRRLYAEGGEFITPFVLRQLFDGGRLKRLYTDSDARGATKAFKQIQRIHAVNDLPEGDRKRREVRAEFLYRVQSRIGLRGAHVPIGSDEQGKPITLLSRVLCDVSAEMCNELSGTGLHDRHTRRHGKKGKAADSSADDEHKNGMTVRVSVPTYYRWKALAPDLEDKRGLEGNISSRGNRKQIMPEVQSTIRAVMLREIEQAKDRRHVRASATVTMKAIKAKVADELSKVRLERPDLSDRLNVPSTTTLNREWTKFSAFDRTVVKYGLGRARRDFRFVKGHDHPEAPFEVVEYDETRMPFFLVDEAHGIPLGKANLCIGICVATHSLGGFNVSFEPFSDLTMMSTLRHVVSLKSYVADVYGGRIKNEWRTGGMMRCVGLDNSRQAWGRSFQEVCKQLSCDRHWLPIRTPWLKPIVEGFFGMMNRMLLRELPGFDIGPHVDRRDYNPALNACIGLRQFTFLFHLWIIDWYQQQKQEGLGHRSPDEVWQELLVNGEPGLLDSSDDIDSLFSVVRSGTLDHRGVRFMNLRYGGQELEMLRLTTGVTSSVKIKFNPSNMLRIRVWDPRLRVWLHGEAYRRDYANELSLHVHKLVQAQSRRRGRAENEEGYVLSLSELKEVIVESMPIVAKAGSAVHLARALGIGSQHLLSQINHAGQLGDPTGPWQGGTVSPLPGGPIAPEHAAGKRRPPKVPTPASTDAPQAEANALRPSRPKKSFVADDSLQDVRLTK